MQLNQSEGFQPKLGFMRLFLTTCSTMTIDTATKLPKLDDDMLYMKLYVDLERLDFCRGLNLN